MNGIRSLSGTPLEEIHDAFEDAFSEYEVRMVMPLERLVEMMTTRSWRPDLSLGAFQDGRLAGFVLTGFREIGGRRVCYDVATGVRRSAQKQGLGDQLLTALLPHLRSAGMQRFVLEVLVNNTAAQKLYERHGFHRSRRLCCFEIRKEDLPSADLTGLEIDPPGLDLSQIDEETFNSFAPSWQNRLASLFNAPELYQVRSIARGGALTGYGIVHKERGSILQIGLDPSARDRGHLAAVLRLLAESTAADKMPFVNVEAGSEMEGLLLEAGFSRTVDQFEMECDL